MLSASLLVFLGSLTYLLWAPDVDPDERDLAASELLGHVLSSFLLTVFLAVFIGTQVTDLRRRRAWILATFPLILLGSELLQVPAPGRGPSLADIGGNAIGLAAGAVAIAFGERSGWFGTRPLSYTVAAMAMAAAVMGPVLDRTTRWQQPPTIDCRSVESPTERMPGELELLVSFGENGLQTPGLLIEPVGDAQRSAAGALVLRGGGFRSTEPPTLMTETMMVNNHFRVEATFTTDDPGQGGPARLVTLSNGVQSHQVNVHVGLDDGRLEVRLRTTCAAYTSFSIDPAEPLEPGVPVSVSVEYAAGLLTTAINGERRHTADLGPTALTNWDVDYPLVIGNEASLDRPFLGTIERLTVSSGPIS